MHKIEAFCFQNLDDPTPHPQLFVPTMHQAMLEKDAEPEFALFID